MSRRSVWEWWTDRRYARRYRRGPGRLPNAAERARMYRWLAEHPDSGGSER